MPASNYPGIPKDFPRKLGERVRELREARGLTQEQLAEAAGCHRTQVGRLEAGRNKAGQPANPHLDLLWRVAAALRVDVDQLVKR